MAQILIPTPLRKFTEQNGSIAVSGSTVLEAIEDLSGQFPGLRQYLLESNRTIKSFIRIYKGDEDIQYLDGAQTKIATGDTLSIIPAIAGGKF